MEMQPVPSVETMTSIISGGPRVELLQSRECMCFGILCSAGCCQMFAALLVSLVVCVLTISGQLWPMYIQRHKMTIMWSSTEVFDSEDREAVNLFQLAQGTMLYGSYIKPVLLLLWAGLLPHMKQAILVYALCRGTKDRDTLPVRVPRAYGWLEALGRFIFFNQWITALHCSLAAIDSHLPGVVNVSGLALDFNFNFRVDPGVGIFISVISQVFAQILGSATLTLPEPLPSNRVTLLSILAPRLSLPRTLSASANFSAEARAFAGRRWLACLMDCAVVLNGILLPVAFVLPLVNVLVECSIKETYMGVVKVNMRRSLKHVDFSVVDMIVELARGGLSGVCMAGIVAVFVVFTPWVRAVMLIIAWHARIGPKTQLRSSKIASWCGLVASLDIFIIAIAVSAFEVPTIFDEVEPLVLDVTFTPAFYVVCLITLMEVILAAVVVRIVTAARAQL